ncbi:MAG: DNA-directed RNA polymerase subunit beta', partial [Candidatus Poribacteria bacterium]|nr:DNA-directed RNA polymerase subunit beta' [Candidatus Poribacteria bacterium]
MNTAFDSISIKIASPDQIKDESKKTSCKRRNPAQGADEPFICPEKGTCSCGEVKKAETINYRSFRPEPEGLFCEAIFGPQKDWECNCGKYKRIKHKGMICDRCGVEITQQRVRRDRLGYIQLAAPVSHIWYFKGIPSRIGTFCELSSRDVERVLYFEGFIVVEVTDPECPLERGQVLTEIEYIEHSNKYWGGFRAGTGAEVIRELLSDIDLEAEIEKLTKDLNETTSHQKKLKIAKQLKQMADFAEIGQRPEWMILDVIPVIPPDLRPLVPLEGGRFATSDLNDLYRRVINRNNRLRKLIQLRSPEVILRNEKRMLQEAVDAFFDNGRHGRRVTGPGNRPLKSLADVLKGKIGRFRQNLLGKRVDYSGRSVIVVGPELGLHQCGIPKRMAVELFKPFIIERLQAYGYTQTIKRAKHIAEHVDSDSPVWEVVEEVIADHPVLLNRPPTLHRLGIQAFLP